MNLKDLLTRYRDFTLNLIEVVEKERFDEIESLLIKRDEIIDNLKDINYSNSEFKDLNNNLQIMKLEEKLKNIMLIKKNNTRDQLDNIMRNANANMKYNSRIYGNSLYFNEKI